MSSHKLYAPNVYSKQNARHPSKRVTFSRCPIPISLCTHCHMYIRVGKTGSFGLWRRVIVYQLSFRRNDPPPPQAMGESFWQKESLLQYTMTLLQGPRDPVLHTLIHIQRPKGPGGQITMYIKSLAYILYVPISIHIYKRLHRWSLKLNKIVTQNKVIEG